MTRRLIDARAHLVAVALATIIAACGDNAAALRPAPEPCGAGFTRDGAQCVDVDECAAATDRCDARASCTNRPGDYACACPTGWVGDGTTCQLAPCKFHYTQGHGDMYTSWSAERGLSLAVRSELEPGKGERAYDPIEVCIHVPRSTYDEIVALGGRPPGPGWDPVGVAEGQPFWYLPEQPIDGVPWFGLASDESPAGGVPLGVFGDHLTLSIRVELPLGATFSAWGTVDDAAAPPFHFSTRTGRHMTEEFTSSHAHLSWAFTMAGEYLVEATIQGALKQTGQTQVSPPVTYRFVVADR